MSADVLSCPEHGHHTKSLPEHQDNVARTAHAIERQELNMEPCRMT